MALIILFLHSKVLFSEKRCIGFTQITKQLLAPRKCYEHVFQLCAPGGQKLGLFMFPCCVLITEFLSGTQCLLSINIYGMKNGCFPNILIPTAGATMMAFFGLPKKEGSSFPLNLVLSPAIYF